MSKSKVCAALLITYLCFGICAELYLKDKDSIQISILPEIKPPYNVSENGKAILRYGFHRIQDCQNFEKAFICIRKCLDLDYQIAHSDKNCMCTCYKNSILSKYKKPITGPPKWKLEAPTTSLPPWAAKEEPKPDDYEINGNITEFVESKEKKSTKVKKVLEGEPQYAKQATPGEMLDAEEKPNAETKSVNREERANEEGSRNAKEEPNSTKYPNVKGESYIEEGPIAQEKLIAEGNPAKKEPIAEGESNTEKEPEQDPTPQGVSNADKETNGKADPNAGGQPNSENKSKADETPNKQGDPNAEKEPEAETEPNENKKEEEPPTLKQPDGEPEDAE